MPIPTPKKQETKEQFMQRCLIDVVMKKEYKNLQQRLAVCNSQFKNK